MVKLFGLFWVRIGGALRGATSPTAGRRSPPLQLAALMAIWRLRCAPLTAIEPNVASARSHASALRVVEGSRRPDQRHHPPVRRKHRAGGALRLVVNWPAGSALRQLSTSPTRR